MPAQRAWIAESRAGNILSNGPPRVQGNAIWQSMMQRMARVSCRGYAGTLQSARETVNQGGTAEVFSSLINLLDLSGAFLLFAPSKGDAL